MNTGFGKHRTVGKEERAKLILIAVAGLLISLVVVLVAVLNHKSKVSANSAIVDPTAALGTVTLFVSEQPVFAGQKLSEVPLRETPWPRKQMPEGAIVNLAALEGTYAKVDIPQNIPLIEGHLTKTSFVGTLPVTPGNRAITIEVDATTGLEGLALPGTRVDVVLTYSNEGELTSKVIVQNARVLSSGGNTRTFSQQQAAVDTRVVQQPRVAARTVTLDVSPKDALKVSTARQLGRLSLVMRSTDDTGVSTETEITANEVGGESSKKKGDRVVSGGCTRGHYRINGVEFQLNCDGTRMQLHTYDEP
jgi:pilus assembly protein CpaB